MEGLEERRLLAVMTDLPTAPAPNLTEYTINRSINAVQAFTVNESESFVQSGFNDSVWNADSVPIGTGFGQQDTVDVFGFLPVSPGQTLTGLSADLDTFAFDLSGGDILDVAVTGAAGQFVIRDTNGLVVFGSAAPFPYTVAPQQTVGNATGTWVVPEGGTYYLTVAPDLVAIGGGYTIGLRAYRPVTEQLEVGDAQIMYLDFDGDVIDGNLLGGSGFIRIPSLMESLPSIGLEAGDVDAANLLIDGVVDQVVEIFEDLAVTGQNGDFVESGIPGEYGIRVLNSRDHGGLIPLNDPRLTRIFIGGAEPTVPAYGIAQTIDMGNFDLSQVAFVNLVETFDAVVDTPRSPTSTLVEVAAQLFGCVTSHEMGHLLGLVHQDSLNAVNSVADKGGELQKFLFYLGVGPDGIFGTSDDIDPVFADDIYDRSEDVFIGTSQVTKTLAHTLSTGTVGGGVSGRVFYDENLNGQSSGDGGLLGVTVFADLNDDGVYTVGEPSTVTEADGNFSLSVSAGTVDILAVAPPQYLPTTTTSRTVTVPNSGNVSGLEFGFGIVTGVKTGIAFDDADGDGVMDANEAPLKDVYIYLDADGDDRPDLGEVSTLTAEDGSYFFNFGTPGDYVIRAVPTPGYQVSFPASGEHSITFDGVAITNEYNFGFRSTLDFGDAPDSYGTLLPNGARHGIIDGLSIGTAPDRDVDGYPSINADGDDLNQLINDEDGVLQTVPLSPGETSNFDITITNTTGATAYLQAFLDFNQDGDFDDFGEQFLSNRAINTGVTNVIYSVAVPVPSGALLGDTYARFRLSKTGNLGAAGFAGSGEVQDHKVTILSGSDIANDDYFDVARNAVSVPLDVLQNDFQLAGNALTIDSLNTVGTKGSLAPVTNNQIFYTPPNGFLGLDSFSYTVRDVFGNQSTASVFVNVKFQSNVPIALDDIFDVPENSVDRPLAVLENDISSINGASAIASVSAGTAGGIISVVAGGQSIRYTPPAGFAGTEQFSYTIQDGAGQFDTATVTVNMVPGADEDNLLEYDINIYDATNGDLIDFDNGGKIDVGQEFFLEVTVEDKRQSSVDEGVFSGFLDVLYTADLVSSIGDPTNSLGFFVEFGEPYFSDSGSFQRGNADVPGLLDDVGSTQEFGNIQDFSGAQVLFRAKMRANAAGIAQFAGDPADRLESESILVGEDDALTVQQLGFGSTQLRISSISDVGLIAAVDDSFPDGRDSNGIPITNENARNVLDVLSNDNLGITGTILEFGLLDGASKGVVFVEDNGTPSDLSDDYLSYQPNTGENGLEEISYFIVVDDGTGEGLATTATVTVALGEQNNNATVAYDFRLVNRAGEELDPTAVTVQDEIGLEISAIDARQQGLSTLVFAGYLDVLYSADHLNVVAPSNESIYNFDVEFGSGFDSASGQGLGGSGTASVPGIIDEIGNYRKDSSFSFPYSENTHPENVLATIFFTAEAPGIVEFKGSPADLSPQHDTLIYQKNDPIPLADIKHSVLSIEISAAGSGQQNQGLAADVNNDSFISPIDALLIINELSLLGEGESSANSSSGKIYPDVNGDDRVTIQDASIVLNVLSRQANSGEGEQLIQTFNEKESADLSPADEVFAGLGAVDLSSTEKIAITDCPKAPEEVDPTESASPADRRDDEEDRLLDLLAGDVDQVWT